MPLDLSERQIDYLLRLVELDLRAKERRYARPEQAARRRAYFGRPENRGRGDADLGRIERLRDLRDLLLTEKEVQHGLR